MEDTLPAYLAAEHQLFSQILDRLNESLGSLVTQPRPQRIETEKDALGELVQPLEQMWMILNPASKAHMRKFPPQKRIT